MSTNLFSEFAGQDKESWKKQVEKELGGKSPDPEFWKISDGLFSDAYYTLEEVDTDATTELQNAQRKTPGWLNTANIKFDAPISTNATIRQVLNTGADAVMLDLGDLCLPKCELTKTLHGIRLSDSPIFFKTTEDPYQAFIEISKNAGYYIKGGFAIDPVAQTLRFNKNGDDSLSSISVVLQKSKTMKDFRPYMIESHIYHEGGANAVQELAFMISALVRCVDHLTDNGLTPLLALNRFFFSVSIGTDHIVEIAKLRALRFLYFKITRAYNLPDELCSPFIHTQTSSFYHTRSLPHTNMIRATSEAMSATIGGCDALTILGFDSDGDEISDRIANNVSLLISNESYIRHVADPASGSYLIDKISVSLADSAWALFLSMEEKGGMAQCVREGFVQDQIERSWNEKLKGLDQSKIMVGVNKYTTNDNFQFTNSDIEEGKKNFSFPIDSIPKRNLADLWLSLKHG